MSSFAVQITPLPTPATADQDAETRPTPEQLAMKELGEPMSLESISATRVAARARDAARTIEVVKKTLQTAAANGAPFDVYQQINDIQNQPVRDAKHANFVLELAKPQFPGFSVELYTHSNNFSLHVKEPAE